MPISAIFENLEAGASVDDIMEWFEGLDRDQIKAVIEFAVKAEKSLSLYSVSNNVRPYARMYNLLLMP